MTICQPELVRRGRIQFVTEGKEKIWLDYDGAAWDAVVEKIDYATPEDEGVRQHWDGKTVYRVLLKAVRQSPKGVVAYSIRPAEH
jgi:hypothetical protein